MYEAPIALRKYKTHMTWGIWLGPDKAFMNEAPSSTIL